jgi:hypothetical protein
MLTPLSLWWLSLKQVVDGSQLLFRLLPPEKFFRVVLECLHAKGTAEVDHLASLIQANMTTTISDGLTANRAGFGKLFSKISKVVVHIRENPTLGSRLSRFDHEH